MRRTFISLSVYYWKIHFRCVCLLLAYLTKKKSLQIIPNNRDDNFHNRIICEIWNNVYNIAMVYNFVR